MNVAVICYINKYIKLNSSATQLQLKACYPNRCSAFMPKHEYTYFFLFRPTLEHFALPFLDGITLDVKH